MLRGAITLALLLGAGTAMPVHAGALSLAAGGRAHATIVLDAAASAPERNAARELGLYLERITGATFPVTAEGSGEGAEIHVGWTRHVRAAEPDLQGLAAEAWVLRREGRRLLLYGGRPRGTLYAVYHFLEEELGVRWWAPDEELVPRRRRLRLDRLDRRGHPAFAYRDIHIVPRASRFLLRNRLNGHFANIVTDWGGSQLYGEPWHVHTFHHYIPPESWFDSRPELFSEVGGVRLGERTQLCLTQPDLLGLVAERMTEYVADSRSEAERFGMTEGRTFGFSPVDVGKPCTCDACTEVVERYGSRGAPLMQFVNRLGEEMERRSPGIVIDTLAYGHTVEPPKEIVLEDNVVIRLAGLYERDFSRSVHDATNLRYRNLVERWAAIAPRLRIWDYTAIFALHGELPLPNLRNLAADYRFYKEQKVEGIFVQHEFPIAADMRDLKLWVLLHLLEEPDRDLDALVRDFTDGYYGKAGVWIRSYLGALERAAAEDPAPVRYRAPVEDHGYLDAPFLAEAHRLFDRAERAVAGDPVLRRRVRHARLTLDRATLILAPRMVGAAGLPPIQEVAERYRATWRVEIHRRYLPGRREVARAEVDREVSFRLQRAGMPSGD